MYTIYQSVAGRLDEIQTFDQGSWIHVVDPTEDEIKTIITELGVEEDFLRAALDEDEAARFETEGNQSLVIVDVPIRTDEDIAYYETEPLAIIMLKTHILTVSIHGGYILRAFAENHMKGFFTQFKTRFVLQLLYVISSQYLHNLRVLDKISNSLEKKMLHAQKNDDLIDMLKVEKSLVYIRTSLHGNQSVLDRLLRSESIKNYSEDQNLLEDVIIENRQAMEMADLYYNILTGTMEAYASMISNNQNDVMKVLTVVTMVMAIPTIISGLYGMNLDVPLDEFGPASFWIVIGITAAISVFTVWLMKKFKLF